MRWLMRRLAAGVLVLLVVSTSVFVVTNVFTDPATASLPLDAPKEQIAQRRHTLGLDRPFVVQYSSFVQGLVTFDLGDSYWQHRPAEEVVLERLPNTLKLVAAGMVVAVVLSILLAFVSTMYHRRLSDGLVLGLTLGVISAPPFWVAYLLVIVFAVNLGLVPTSGTSGFSSVILPALSLGLASAGRLTQMLRQAVLDEMSQPYVLTVESRGFSRRYAILRHASRNVAASYVTFAGWELTRMLTGYSIIIEVVFAWPGVGKLAFDSVDQKDLILLQGAVLMLASFVVLTNVVVDILRRVLDPRVELA